MEKNDSGWKKVKQNIVATIAPKPLGVELLASKEGLLRMSCRSGAFPEGELLLLISSWEETEHWSVPAWLEGNVLTADLSGVEAAWDPENEKPFIITLAKREGKKMTRYPLRARKYLGKLQPGGRCNYFYNDRKLWKGPVDSFCREGEQYEAVPRYMLKGQKTVVVALTVVHQELRYWRQFRYGVKQLIVQDGMLLLGAKRPKDAPRLVGFSLHRADGSAQGQQFFPILERPADQEDEASEADETNEANEASEASEANEANETGEASEADETDEIEAVNEADAINEIIDQKGVTVGAIDLSALPMDGERYAISGVIRRGEMLFHVPLCIIDRLAHQAAELLANGGALAQEGETGCYLWLDKLGQLYLQASDRPLTCQPGPEGVTLREALEQDLLPVVGHRMIRDLGGQDWQWQFELPGVVLEEGHELILRAKRKGELLLCPVQVLSSDPQGSLLMADLTPVAQSIQNSRTARWMLSLAIRRGDEWQNVYLRCPERMIRRKLDKTGEYLNYQFSYGEPLGEVSIGGQTVESLICCPADGYCKLQASDRVRRYEEQVTCRAERLRVRFGKLQFIVRCPRGVPGEWTGIAFTHRYKLEVDRKIYFAPARKIVAKGGSVWLTGEVDLADFQFEPSYWDIRAAFRGADGYDYEVRIRKTGARKKTRAGLKWEKLGAMAERTLFSGSCRNGENMTVTLYETAKQGFALASQEYSPYSGLAFRLKERLALILFRLFRKQLKQKNIYLCFEKFCCMAQDNGFYFFRHCMESGMEEKLHGSIYYIIDKKQPDYQERLLPYQDHVIQFMSLKHMIYILASRLLISCDAKPHSYAWGVKESIILPRIINTKKLVFLQHGVIALKRVGVYGAKTNNAVDLFVTSNQREHDIIVDELGYAPGNVIITGLARWDVLKDKGLEERHILVMPTWRNWLEYVPDLVFEASDYYRNYMSLLNDPRLADLLERQDLYLDFYIHPKFRDYIHDFSIQEGGRVRLIPFGEEPLNQLMMGCKMLVTDYSSVCWDVYYQGKPVLFYQFDVDKYNETTGAYIDLETELFGDRVMTPEELLAKLEEYAENDFRLPEVYAEMRPRMYAYIDQNNSQRICEEIMKRHW